MELCHVRDQEIIGTEESLAKADAILALPSPRSRAEDEALLAEMCREVIGRYKRPLSEQPYLMEGPVAGWSTNTIARRFADILASGRREGDEADREMIEGLTKLRDQYASQAKFADHEAAAYFRDFVRRLEGLLALAERNLSAPPLGGGDEDQGGRSMKSSVDESAGHEMAHEPAVSSGKVLPFPAGWQMRKTTHLNGGREWFGYGFQCIQEPRLGRIDRYYRNDRDVVRTWKVDGHDCADAAAAWEALQKPPKFTDAEIECLRQVGDEPADLRKVLPYETYYFLQAKGAVTGLRACQLTEVGRAAIPNPHPEDAGTSGKRGG